MRHESAPLISADDAISRIEPGQRVVVQPGATPWTLLRALAARPEILRRIDLVVPDGAALAPLSWGGGRGPALVRGDRPSSGQAGPGDWLCGADFLDLAAGDVLLTQVRPPDPSGHCGFGGTLLNKKALAEGAAVVLAEVRPGLIAMQGDGRIHAGSITCLVAPADDGADGPPPPRPGEVDEVTASIARHVNGLLRDGDTIGLGYGSICRRLAEAGAFRGKADLGLQSLHAPAGLLREAVAGGFPGSRKGVDAGKVVASDFEVTADLQPELAMHPLYRVREYAYVSDPSLLASLSQLVSIHQAGAIDLTGQIVGAPTGGPEPVPSYRLAPFYLASMLSVGGRSITVLPAASIRPSLPAESVVSVSRTLVDYVVTEYGVAELVGRSQRERALELVGISHPRLRDELDASARRLFWPAP